MNEYDDGFDIEEMFNDMDKRTLKKGDILKFKDSIIEFVKSTHDEIDFYEYSIESGKRSRKQRCDIDEFGYCYDMDEVVKISKKDIKAELAKLTLKR